MFRIPYLALVAGLALAVTACGDPDADPRGLPSQDDTDDSFDGGMCSDCGPGLPPDLHLPTDDDGFTVLTPSADSRVIYVSSSEGDDANDGSSPDQAVATIDRGKSRLRHGFPDQLLFRRGDVWTSGIGRIVTAGRSPEEPLVFGAYGDLAEARPRFEVRGGGNAIQIVGGEGTPNPIDNVAGVSLELVAVDREPADGNGAPNGGVGMSVLWPVHGLLVEDCVFQYFKTSLTIQSDEAANVVLRRNLFLDSWSRDAVGHSQGIYMQGVAGLLIEENVFDHNGWSADHDDAQPTIYNHNMYIQDSTRSADIVVRDNVVMRGSSHGVQLRSGGTIEGNLFVQNAINILGSLTEGNPYEDSVLIADNVVVHGSDIAPRPGYSGGEGLPRGWGIELAEEVLVGGILRNILAHCDGSMCRSIGMGVSVPVADNIVYDWPSGSGNNLAQTSGSYPDPERTIASYSESLGAEASIDAFIEQVREQRKGHWRPAFTARVVNAYFREGFGL